MENLLIVSFEMPILGAWKNKIGLCISNNLCQKVVEKINLKKNEK